MQASDQFYRLGCAFGPANGLHFNFISGRNFSRAAAVRLRAFERPPIPPDAGLGGAVIEAADAAEPRPSERETNGIRVTLGDEKFSLYDYRYCPDGDPV